MVLKQGSKENQFGAEVKVDIFVVDTEEEVEILPAVGEETHVFRKGQRKEYRRKNGTKVWRKKQCIV